MLLPGNLEGPPYIKGDQVTVGTSRDKGPIPEKAGSHEAAMCVGFVCCTLGLLTFLTETLLRASLRWNIEPKYDFYPHFMDE